MGVQAEPVLNLLEAIGPSRKTVDFWSLDVEGGEASILETTDFNKITVGVLLVEMNKNEDNNERVKAVASKEGWLDIGTTKELSSGLDLDHVFVNPKYFESHDLKVPQRGEITGL